MKKPKISIIIPVYNSEKSIGKLVNIILEQKFENIEVITIDDGSTDGSLKILKKIASCDKRLKVSSQKNRGPAAARNVGIDKAIGKYVMFIDADDEIHSEMIQRMVENIEKTKADMVVCGMLEVLKLKTVEHKFDERLITRNLKTEVLKSLGGENCFYSLCNKLFVRELIGDLRLREDLRFGEDLCFVLDYLKKCKRVSVLEKILYCYLAEGGTFSQSAKEYRYRVKNAEELRKFTEEGRIEDSWAGWVQTKWALQYLGVAKGRVKVREMRELLSKKPRKHVVGTKKFVLDRGVRLLSTNSAGIGVLKIAIRAKRGKIL
jgi:glycosyltransferase involved in cell wall biosynthesis